MKNSNNLIQIGKIIGHHGIRGELKVYPYSDNPEKFLDFSHLHVYDSQNGVRNPRVSAKTETSGEDCASGANKSTRLEIVSARLHKNLVLIRFELAPTIEKGQWLLDQLVYIEKEIVDDGEGHFIVDLIGLDIVSRQGEKLGVLRDVITNTAQHIYEVERHQASEGKKFFYIPVVDEFVKKIDLENGKIIVELIEGLI